jgi:Ig-like domain from next to BRCA1 gene
MIFLAIVGGGATLLLLMIGAFLILRGPSRSPQEELQAVGAAQTAALMTQAPIRRTLPPTGTEKGAASDTPLPLESLTLAPPAITPTSACTDLALLVYDVTVPDNTHMPPDRSFAKAWRLQNAGTCTWTAGYALVFDSGAQMGGPSSQNLTGEVAPGATVDLSVVLTTPSAAGTYRGNWKLRNGREETFALADGEPFHVQLIVSP